VNEFLKACVAWVNLPYTVMLTVVGLYWLTVLMGIFDIDLFGGGPDAGGEVDADVDLHLEGAGDGDADIHVDGDGDADGDSDTDADGDADGDSDLHAHGGSMIGSIPKILNIGDVPITIFLSFFILSAWAISITANHYLGNDSFLISLLMAIPNVIASLIVAKIASFPFGALFSALGKGGEKHKSLIGEICVISSSKADSECGQALVETPGAPHLLNVRTREGIALKEGEKALIILHEHEKGVYIIRPYDYVDGDIKQIEK